MMWVIWMNLPKAARYAFPAVVLALAVVGAPGAAAQDEDESLPDRFVLKLGGYNVLDSSTELFLSRTNTLGTRIDFERDLGGEDTVNTPRVEGYFRFNDRHRVEFRAFQTERTGSRRLARTIQFGDRTFTVESKVDSRIQNDFYKLAYAYSFYHVPKVELSVSAGVEVMDFEAELEDTTGAVSEKTATTAPMPVFGFRMDYSVTPRLTVRVNTETFYIEYDDFVRGSLIELEAGLDYRLFRNFGLGASLSRLALDVNIDDDGENTDVTDLYRGAYVYGLLYF
ncbi:MAG: hypothetical protein PVF40_05670 [Ectothiorhodospiraceae bacterium]|jgi:hypothetical protein